MTTLSSTRRSVRAFAFVLLAAGCAPSWGPPTVNLPTPLHPRTAVKIWSGGEVQKWHAVVISESWVSGIPYQMPITCDSCVLRIPRSEVDSMRLDNKGPSGLAILGIVAAALVAEAAVCALIGAKSGC